MRTRRGCAAVFLFAVVVSGSAASERSPHELYNALNTLRADSSAVYAVKPENRIELRRFDFKLSFEEGRLAFFVPFAGRITGLVFSGRGHALAAPRDPVEKQQMGRFLGTPVLDLEFTSAYLRFTDDTPADLLAQLKSGDVPRETDPGFTSSWDSVVAGYNPNHSLRLLFHQLAANPRDYFYAAIGGASVGPFDFLFDMDRPEPFLLGQVRKNGNRSFFDVWSSYAPPDFSAPVAPFQAVGYSID